MPSATTSASSAGRQHAQVIQSDLKQIGIDVESKLFPTAIRRRQDSPRAASRSTWRTRYVVAWVDPYQYVDLLLDGRTIQATGNTNRSYFNSPHYNRLIDQAGRLSGQARYKAYGKLALEIAKNAAPMAGNINRNTASSSPAASAACGRRRGRTRRRPGRALPQVAPFAWTVTQILPSATAIPRGLFPTRIVVTTSLVVGSIRDTVPSPLFATQRDPAP